MNRTLRNGLAVAGMAGGMMFLGHAVANADVTQDNTAPVAVTGQGGTDSDVDIDQSNSSHVDQDANAGNAGVGVLIVNGVGGNEVNAGGGGEPSIQKEKPKPPPAPPTTTVRVAFDTNITNDVAVDSTISHSGNATISDSPNVKQTNSAPVSLTSTGGDKKWDGKKWDGKKDAHSGPSGGSDDNDVDIDQHNNSTVDQDANAGDVGVGVGIVNLVGGNTVNCWGGEHSQVICDVSFNTTINNNVDIHSIICGSGNATIGTLPSFVCGSAPAAATPATPATPAPVQQAKPAAAVHAVKTAAAAKKVSAAGKNELAFTGAETSTPLTFGLLALGAGGALTLAGRRRNTTTV